jgi:ribose 5-phosphate isomerase B
MKIALGADHAGFALKEQLKQHLAKAGYELLDEGTNTATDSVDYPEFARTVAHDVAEKRADFGLLVCGSGIGMAITANKVGGIRAVSVITEQEAQLSREHNDANVIAIGARLLKPDQAVKVVDAFLRSSFAYGRHTVRVERITAIEQEEAQAFATKKAVRG